ncbi:hypothetical protein ACFQV2_17215 [Actinokineospora soli]|uniref:Beta-galactosidase galactose-binding domain-containing protein n=1 Tax=Actinokineospora soli TaxID=1048753 RepID=A0ABW2TPB1_9PSEU
MEDTVPSTTTRRPTRSVVALRESARLFDSTGVLGTTRLAARAASAGHPGLVLCETTLDRGGPTLLDVPGLTGRAQVFLDGQPVGTLDGVGTVLSFTVHTGSVLALLAEGGLTGRVLLDGVEADDWTVHTLPLGALPDLPFTRTGAPGVGPTFHRGRAHLPDPVDLHLALADWTRGHVWANGAYLGSYGGGLRVLPVPARVLRAGTNEVTVLELVAARGPAVVLRR